MEVGREEQQRGREGGRERERERECFGPFEAQAVFVLYLFGSSGAKINKSSSLVAV